MNEITIEKVYNKWLAVTRSARNKPFSLRKDFSKIKEEDFYPYLEKLTDFFRRYPHLFRDEFFLAPFKMYDKDRGFYSIEFYASHKGIVTCSKYFQELENMSADEQVEEVRKSYKFIYKFCREKNIELREYPFYSTGYYPDFMIHLKNHEISYYTLFSFPALYYQVANMDLDVKHIFFGENFKLSDFEKKYTKSKTLIEKSADFFNKVSSELSKKVKK